MFFDSESNTIKQKDPGLHWFAVRVFKGRVFRIKEDAEEAGNETYMAMRILEKGECGNRRPEQVQIIPQLIFIRCTFDWLRTFKDRHFNEIFIYSEKPGNAPAPIRDVEMDLFKFVTSTNNGRDVEYYDDTMPEFSEGERVRVIDGLYKGAEGYVKRIKKDRKLLVAVEGVAVIAISHIPVSYLEKVEKDS